MKLVLPRTLLLKVMMMRDLVMDRTTPLFELPARLVLLFFCALLVLGLYALSFEHYIFWVPCLFLGLYAFAFERYFIFCARLLF